MRRDRICMAMMIGRLAMRVVLKSYLDRKQVMDRAESKLEGGEGSGDDDEVHGKLLSELRRGARAEMQRNKIEMFLIFEKDFEE